MSQRTRAPHTAMEATNSMSVAELEMEKVRAIGSLELEYVAWNLPKTEPGEKRGRTKGVMITPLALFEPGSYFLSPVGGSENAWLKKRCSQFHSTPSTRCVRDIKRPDSWKLYNTVCTPATGAESHFVRIKFPSPAASAAFVPAADLLNALAAKRFLQAPRKDKIHPFGIGFDCGVQKSKERLYIISNCAKQTPYLRRVAVAFEVLIDGEWKRLDNGNAVDRIGFATYRSAPKSAVLAASTLSEICFKDDAYLRFARVTLRFGAQAERTVLDLGRGFEPTLEYGKNATTITMKKVRVRTCEGARVSAPIRSQARFVFTDMATSRSRSGAFRRNSGTVKRAANEAEKAFTLLQKTVGLASTNTLGLEDDIEDDAIFQMNIQKVHTDAAFSIRAKGASQGQRVSLGQHFRNSTLFLVPCYESNGMNIVLQSRSGRWVLRQYVDVPVRFIGAIEDDAFSGPRACTLVREGVEYSGMGGVKYMFETMATDAKALADILMEINTRLYMFYTTVTVAQPDPDSISPPPSQAGSRQGSPRISREEATPRISAEPPRIPEIRAMPSIHLSRAGTVATMMSRKLSTRAPPVATEIAIPPRAASPPGVYNSPPVYIIPQPQPQPQPTQTVSASPPQTHYHYHYQPQPQEQQEPQQPVYKVPRKPVPSSHSRSTSSNSSISSQTQLPRTFAPQRGPSMMPGGRLYDLRAAKLKGLDTSLGLKGTVHAVQVGARR